MLFKKQTSSILSIALTLQVKGFMSTLKKWIILTALLLATLISYSLGYSQETLWFIVLGALFEVSFWFGLLTKKQKNITHISH
jgi:Sec-independent protein secretion pathway component TatC